MTDSGHNRSDQDRSEFTDLIDRYGADLSHWPDRERADAARMALLTDRDLRARLAAAAGLADRMSRLRARIDAGIASTGAAERVAAGTFARLTPRITPAFRWAAAAAIVVAACLGTATSLTADHPDRGIDLVMLGPMFAGPLDVKAP